MLAFCRQQRCECRVPVPVPVPCSAVPCCAAAIVERGPDGFRSGTAQRIQHTASTHNGHWQLHTAHIPRLAPATHCHTPRCYCSVLSLLSSSCRRHLRLQRVLPCASSTLLSVRPPPLPFPLLSPRSAMSVVGTKVNATVRSPVTVQVQSVYVPPAFSEFKAAANGQAAAHTHTAHIQTRLARLSPHRTRAGRLARAAALAEPAAD